MGEFVVIFWLHVVPATLVLEPCAERSEVVVKMPTIHSLPAVHGLMNTHSPDSNCAASRLAQMCTTTMP